MSDHTTAFGDSIGAVMAQSVRPVPRPTPLLTARSAQSSAAPMPPQPAYDRARFERAVIASNLHRGSRIVAFVLAHWADASGHLPAGGNQSTETLTHATGLSGKNVQLSLLHLERRGYLSRPDIRDWEYGRGTRPVTLSVPSRSTRTDPAHTDPSAG